MKNLCIALIIGLILATTLPACGVSRTAADAPIDGLRRVSLESL